MNYLKTHGKLRKAIPFVFWKARSFRLYRRVRRRRRKIKPVGLRGGT